MNVWHADALKKSKGGCAQVVLHKGFNIVQSPARLAEKYVSEGYKITARYVDGKGQTFYAVEEENLVELFEKVFKTPLKGGQVYLERNETFNGPRCERDSCSFKLYVCKQEKLIATHEAFDEQAEYIERYVFTMGIFGITAIPNLPDCILNK